MTLQHGSGEAVENEDRRHNGWKVIFLLHNENDGKTVYN